MNNRTVHETLPIVITGPRKLHLALAIIGLGGCFIGYMKFGNSGFEGKDDYLTLIVLVTMGIWFTYKFLFPKTKLIFSKDGIWTRVHGWKSWEDFGGVAIEKQQRGKARVDVLLLLFEIEESPQEIAHDFFDLSISASKFRKLLQGPLKPYMEL